MARSQDSKLTLVLTLLVLLLTSCTAQAEVPYMSRDPRPAVNPDLWSSLQSGAAITRADSCTVALKDAYFQGIPDGDYVVNLDITFEAWTPKGESTTKHEMNVFLREKLQTDPRNPAPTVDILKTQPLVANQDLTGVNFVHVRVFLSKAKNSFDEFMGTFEPLFGAAVTDSAVYKVIHGQITKPSQTDSKNADQVLADEYFLVPENIFEYGDLSASNSFPLLENSQPFAIPLAGKIQAVDPDTLPGLLGKILNKVSKFILDRKVVDFKTVKCAGVVRLYFTKTTIPLQPVDLLAKLREIGTELARPKPELDVVRKWIGDARTQADALRKNGYLDERSRFGIDQYLEVSEYCLNGVCSDDAVKKDTWLGNFGKWYSNFDLIGSMYDARAVAIKDVYPNGQIAKVFVPYTLPGDLAGAFYLRQIEVHKALNAKGDYTLAQALPQSWTVSYTAMDYISVLPETKLWLNNITF